MFKNSLDSAPGSGLLIIFLTLSAGTACSSNPSKAHSATAVGLSKAQEACKAYADIQPNTPQSQAEYDHDLKSYERTAAASAQAAQSDPRWRDLLQASEDAQKAYEAQLPFFAAVFSSSGQTTFDGFPTEPFLRHTYVQARGVIATQCKIAEA